MIHAAAVEDFFTRQLAVVIKIYRRAGGVNWHIMYVVFEGDITAGMQTKACAQKHRKKIAKLMFLFPWLVEDQLNAFRWKLDYIYLETVRLQQKQWKCLSFHNNYDLLSFSFVHFVENFSTLHSTRHLLGPTFLEKKNTAKCTPV